MNLDKKIIYVYNNYTFDIVDECLCIDKECIYTGKLIDIPNDIELKLIFPEPIF